jgi:hypothetical protein
LNKRAISPGRKTHRGARKGGRPLTNVSANSNEIRKAWVLGSLPLPSASPSDEMSEWLVWMSEEGDILNAEQCDRLDAEFLVSSFASTVANPQAGKAGLPSSIRTSSSKLATWLREHLNQRVEVILGDTPEIAGALETLKSIGNLPSAAQGRPSYFASGIKEEHVARFFECAAGLYRAQPWRIVKSDTDVICVRVPSIHIENSAAIVIGQNRQCYGILVFPSYEAYMAYVALATAHVSGVESPVKVEFISLNYERAQDLEPVLRAEVKRFGWTLAGPTAYPWPIAVGENWSTRAVLLDELTLLACLAEAMPRFLTETRQFQTSSVTRTNFKGHYRVPFLQHSIDIELEFPHPSESGDDAA